MAQPSREYREAALGPPASGVAGGGRAGGTTDPWPARLGEAEGRVGPLPPPSQGATGRRALPVTAASQRLRFIVLYGRGSAGAAGRAPGRQRRERAAAFALPVPVGSAAEGAPSLLPRSLVAANWSLPESRAALTGTGRRLPRQSFLIHEYLAVAE